MALSEREVEIPIGRRDGDGRAHLSIFADGLLAFSVEGHGERAPTVLLTSEQARNLLHALEELLSQMEEEEQAKGERIKPLPWDGQERRTTGELR